MEKTKILSIVFLVVALGLGYYLSNSIYTSITESEKIAAAEAQVIEKLTMIREAQIAFQAVNGRYTSDWAKLKSFVDTGRFYIINKKENIITLAYGADSISVEIDTIGTVFVKDSVFTTEKYPNFNLENLEYVPTKGEAKFAMWANKIKKAGLTVDVVEVWNTAPVNPRRKEDNEARTKKPLRFGSRVSITTAGNWE
ncbi:hypothetical protein [Reichenbachiella versicolor]|uniref:hypothetical protein n=1 Tax=Reichenbachiella versicolor TaxID=1821036 RepID=UPI000D6E4D52|nr:hypothetical protein [Reichenbachiella versicolor]